jgi:hypothetical protein
VSDNNFKIKAAVTLTAPNGNEAWSVGTSRNITWTTTGTIPNVRLEYSKDNFASLVLIASSAPGTGSYSWTIPDDISTTVKVRVTDVRDATVVMLYLLPNVNRRLRPLLLEQPPPGARNVAPDYDKVDWPPQETRPVQGEERTHLLLRWTVPPKEAPR